MIYISGPGHGGNSPIANTYIEGTYSDIYKDITEDKEGLKNYSNNSLFQEEHHLTQHQKYQEVSMKVVN